MKKDLGGNCHLAISLSKSETRAMATSLTLSTIVFFSSFVYFDQSLLAIEFIRRKAVKTNYYMH